MNECELKSLPDMDFISEHKEPEIKQLDFGPASVEKSSILERSVVLVQSLKNLGIACESMSQAKKLMADTPVERLEGDLLTYQFEPEPVVEQSTPNAPVAHSEWGTAGIGSSDDDDEEEQKQEEPLEDVETDPHTDVDESFFVDADEEAPVDEAQASDALMAESLVEDVHHVEAPVQFDASESVKVVALAEQAPVSTTDDLTVPGVADYEPVYESFIPEPNIEVPAHVEAEFKDVLPFLAPSPVEPVEDVQEAVMTAIEVFDAAVFESKPLPKPVPTALDRQLRLAEKDSVSAVKLEFMTDETHARFHSLETRELNFRRLAYKSLKESAELTEGLKASIEALDFPAIEKFLKVLNKSVYYKRLSEDLETTVRDVMRRSQKRWGK
ncbi:MULTISPECIES: hypothetical protein [Pseudomonas syringae group]|uniref:hypothetical protein n=1 Tax=Pseudomonas syringae group TaxID=136849 RepID=UPI000F7A8F47|nr:MULTISPECIES: hypothetical protein [Pseudomonas syringae group]MCK9715218.1 hypothetical protein [Pseudomonas syringae pv. syringae]MCK9761300.1 hypothetical protein [Pseudomonas syringae pv. syringae]